MKKPSAILALFLLIIITGCSSNILNDVVIVNYLDDIKEEFEIKILDKEENNIISESFKLKGDVSYNYYDYQSLQLFLYGPGGIIQIDIKEKNIQKQTDESTSHVFKIEDRYGSVSNIGFQDDGYVSRIKVDTSFFDVNYAINSIKYNDNKLFISNLPLENEIYFMDTYDIEGNFLNRDYFEDFGRIDIIDKDTVYLTNDYYQIADQKIVLPSPLFSIYDSVELINGTIMTLSFNYESMTCSISDANNNHDTFDDCKGYTKIDDNKYLIKSKDDLILYDFLEDEYEKSTIKEKHSTLSDIFPYKKSK